MATAKRKPSTHPPYFEMITDAITALKDRTGSSQQAIQKFLEEKHKELPATFRKLLFNSLKKGVADGKLVKVKASYKLPPKVVRRPAAVIAAAVTAAAAPAKKAATTRAGKPGIYVRASGKASAVLPRKAVRKGAVLPRKGAVLPRKVVRKGEEKPKAKGKGGVKRKTVAALTEKKKPAKVAKTVAKSTPSKKVVVVKAKAKKAVATPTKKAAARRVSARKGKK